MTKSVDSPPFLPALRVLGYQFRLIGWGSFWLKLVLTLVTAGIVLFASIAMSGSPRPVPGAAGQVAQASPSVSIGIPFLIGGVICLAISVFWSFTFTRLGRRFLVPTAQMQPSKTETTRRIKLALMTDLIGMALMVIAGEAVGGVLFGKALSQGVGSFINIDPSRFVQPFDLLVVLSCIHGITGLFIGLVSALWLLQQTTQQKPPTSSEVL